MLNVNDPDQVKRAAQWAKLDDKNRHEALKALVAGAPGRAYLYDLLQACGVWRNTFSSDALQMAYNVGQVSIGLWIMDDLQKVAPRALQQMTQERNQRNDDRSAVLNTIAADASEESGRRDELADPAADPWKLDNPVDYSATD